ncbi:MAG: hypothetical protein ACXWZZ_14935 [Solirubrobacteraceae bacterium]
MPTKPPTFELARFTWGAPDRLELSGRFRGLPEGPTGLPELLISGANGEYRLPVLPNSLSGPLANGRPWDAVFAWQEPPVAFDAARLTFGGDLVVELPSPDARRTRRRTLVVSRMRSKPANGAVGQVEEAPAASDGVQQLRAQAELLATQEALAEARSTLQRTQEELARVRDDLGSEREQRSADAVRFRGALAEMRDTAEGALAAEQSATRDVRAELCEALEMIDAKNAALSELEAAESSARTELEGAHARRAELERAAAEADGLRGELDLARSDAEEARAQHDRVRSVVEEAREDAERLLERLSGDRDAAGETA